MRKFGYRSFVEPLNPVIWDNFTGHRHLFCQIWVDEVGFVSFLCRNRQGGNISI